MLRKIRSLLLLSLLAVAALSVTAQAIERSEIPDKYKWREDYIYPSAAVWEKAFDAIRGQLDQMEAFKGTLAAKTGSEGAKNLIAFFGINEKAEVEISRVIWFAYYNFQVDMRDPEWISRRDNAFALASEYYQRLVWVEPELLTISKDTLLHWADSYPELKAYHLKFSDMFALRAHSLSEPEERIIALSGELFGGPNDIYTNMTSVDMDWPEIVDENGVAVKASASGWREGWRSYPDRETRRKYYQAFMGRFLNFGNTYAATIAAQYKADVYYARARNFDNTLQANLSPTFVPEEVFTNLIQTTRMNLSPLHRYESIRKRELGLDSYTIWDDYVALGKAAEEKRLTWEEASQTVVDAVAPLGKQYVADAKVLLDPVNRFADPFTSPGKIGGAWSHNSLDEPARMIFNFDYEKGLNFDNVTTIAHELGHSVSANYTMKTQPVPLRGEMNLISEVPSTTNETFLYMKELENARAEYKRAKGAAKEAARQNLIYLLDQVLGDGRNGFYRQIMFAEWEREAHKLAEEGAPITQESLTNLFAGLQRDYFGPAMESNEFSDIGWASVPHFYLGYYTYSYAVGGVAAMKLATDIRAEADGDKTKRGSLARYQKFLAAGSSEHAMDQLKAAGVDFSTAAPVEAYVKYFGQLVDELDALTQGGELPKN